MSAKILMINGSQSKFFTKDAQGNITELKEGDTIDENAIVYGDKSNPSSASIEIAMNNGAGNVVLSGAQEQLFDKSMTDEPSMEGGLADKSLKELDDELYAKDEESDTKEEDLGILDETAAGEEQAKQNEGGESVFEYRDANSTRAASGLRDASFGADANEKNPDGNEQKPPLNTEISIEGTTLVAEGNSATYTLNVTDAPLTDLFVSVRISHIDTNSNDIVSEVVIVKIDANTTSGTFTIDNFDSLLAESDEDYSVTIISATGGGYDSLTVGNDKVITTITDDDVAIQASNDSASAAETGHEFINAEDEANDTREASGNVLANDTSNNATTITQISFGGVVVDIPTDGTDISIDGEYGTLTINNNGVFTFVVDDSDSAVDALNIGDNVTDGFVYTISDAQNPDISANIEIKIDGMDDAPVINSISANNQPLHIVDGLLDINDDGIADVISPEDLVSRDKGLLFNESNGNITIDMGTGDSSLAVDYHGGTAGYKNILGFYEKDADGNIVDVKVIYVDKGDDDGQGGNFDAFLGNDSLSLGTLNNLSGEVGFFIIPNGYSNASIKNAIDNGFEVSIDPTTFQVIFTNPNDSTDTASLNKAYYTDNDMSTDGRDHAIITKNPDGGLTIGMEDLPQGGTDQDYDDVVFTIKPCATLHSPTQTTLFSEGFEGVNQGAGDTNGRAWYVEHGTDGDNVLVSNSGHEWRMNDAGLEMRTDDGIHGLDTADGSGTYVELDTHSQNSNSSITTDVNLGQGNDTFTLSFNFMPRPGQADTSDMKFSLDGKEVAINVDAQGNITYEAPSGVEVKITPVDGSSWFKISATFSGIETSSAELNFQAAGNEDSLGAYIDNIELVGTDYSTANTILTDVSLSDVDDANLESAVLTLTNFKVGDVIDADNLPSGITATVVGGVVTLSGSASVSDYELALESLTFGTTSEDREVREFEIVVFDGDKHSNTMNVSLDIGGCSLNTGEYLNTTTAVDNYGFQNSEQGEFEVTSFGDADQSEPDITALSDGGFVVAWTEVSGTTYNGAESNDLNNDGDVKDSGETVWTRGTVNHDVFIQRYDADGEKVGDATRVNTFVENTNEEGGRSQHDVNVVGLENGSYLVTWTSDDHNINVDNWDNGSRYIQGQIYDVNGSPICEEFTVARAEYDPIIGLPDGGFIVTYSADARLDNTDHGRIDNPIFSDTHDGSGFAVVAQRFDALGNKVGDSIVVNQTILNDQIDSDIVMLSDTSAIMTWQSEGTDGDGYGVYAQRLELTNDGLVLVGQEIAVNHTTNGNQTDPEVTALDNGKAVITWESEGQGIVAQILDTDGSKVGNETIISDNGINPVITALQNAVIVVYEDNGAIYSKTFDENTTTMPDAVLISDSVSGQSEPSITTLEDGGYVISWQNGDGISAHRFTANGKEFIQSDFDMNEDSSITIDVATLLVNDSDIEGHSFSLTSVQNAVHGSVVLSADGLSVTFTPDEDYNGKATFDYTITDELGATDNATVHLDVKPMGEPTVFVGTLCSSDIHSSNVTVNEGEDLIFGVRLSGVEASSILTLALADGSAIDADYNESTYKYSFDGQTWNDVPANGEIAVNADTKGVMVKIDSVTDSLIENSESFTLSATLSGGETAVGTGTILDVQTPPTADEVTTTSNLNSDDTALRDFSNDTNTPDINDIAFFKKFDVGGGLDGSGAENDLADPADLGGGDAQSLESSLSYEITQLASENSYGDLYLEANGSFTKITDANMQTMTFGNGDNVYWVATHEQVPTDGDVISLGGADDFGSVQSVTDSWSSVSLKAIGLDGEESVVTYNSRDGVGVQGVAGGTNNQIGYDARSENTETMIVDFASTVTSAKIGITHLYNNGSESEVGVVDAYLDGNKVGSFTFSNNAGDNNFTPDFVLSTQNIGSGNSGTSQAGYFNIEGLAFDQLQFSANPYVNQNGVGDSSDYFLASIDVNEVADAQYQYKVTDESGLESDVVDVVIDVETSTPMHLNEVQTVNNFDTVILEDGIKLDFSDDNLERIENIEEIQMNGNAEIIHLSLEDILDMTEPSNSLIITGNDTDSFDASNLNESGDWTQTSMVDNGDNTTYSYSHSDGYSVELTIDEEIITTGM
ncbi:cadherin-like domain-containing protein [Sulfurimonas sp.]|uniref:cadherin-like domain-containing protein n=1 Tax=Sulfurimonas sp. TaxID=2022749 RepID=UPI002AB00474|nr:cadherin-like domain-containing protein [Sulfurimonas sp.]